MAEFYSTPDLILKILFVIGVLSFVFLIGASLEYRRQRAVQIFLMLMMASGAWLFFNLWVLLSPTQEMAEVFIRLRFIPLSLMPVLWLHFCLELFRKPGAPSSNVGFQVFAFIPIVVTVACFTPALHPLLIYDVKPFVALEIPGYEWRVGPIIQLHIFCAYIVLFLTIGVCLRGLRAQTLSHRRYAIWLIAAISMYVVPEILGFIFYSPVRFWSLPSLTQIPSILFIYSILHQQQVVRTFSNTNDKLFESLPVPALLFNRDNQLCLFNSRAEELFNISVASAGLPMEEIVPQGLEGELPSFETLKASYLCEVVDPQTNDARYFETNAAVIDVQGLFGEKMILVSFAEVTELKRHTLMNQRLMSVLSHDLLGNLSGLVTLSNHRHPQHWDLIADTSRSSVDLLKNVLLWTSSRGGFYNCHKEPFDLQELAQNVVKQSSSFLSPKELQIQGSLMKEPLIAFVDLKMFSAILRNLLSNAARFSPHRGVIEVHGVLKDDDIELIVSDQGPGMSPEIAKTVLSDHDRPVNAASQGYGIGLFLVQQFVKMHDGKMEVSGNQYGGCSMKITFPAIPPPL